MFMIYTNWHTGEKNKNYLVKFLDALASLNLKFSVSQY